MSILVSTAGLAAAAASAPATTHIRPWSLFRYICQLLSLLTLLLFSSGAIPA